MLEVHFEGWFQCRLARDPDPSDEKRGVSGASFATVYEPDLDRIIRLNDPVASRTMFMPAGHQVPEAGVSVKAIFLDGQKQQTHPLIGARVDLLDEPKFQCLNGVFHKPGYEPIDPFHISISRNDIVLRRKDVWDPAKPHLSMYDLAPDSPLLQRRQPSSQDMRSIDLREATGISDPAAYISRRIADLQSAIETKKKEKETVPGDAIQIELHIAGLQQRLEALTMAPELCPIFEFPLSADETIALDALEPSREFPVTKLSQAKSLVKEFADRGIRFSEDSVIQVQPDCSIAGAANGGEPAAKAMSWTVKDPRLLVDPAHPHPVQLHFGVLEQLLHLPARFRMEKILQRGTQYAIIAFEETEVWQSKIFRILLDSRLFYQFDIRGPFQVQGNLGGIPASNAPWPVSFWLGAWDNDALSGFIKGYLQIPLRAVPQ